MSLRQMLYTISQVNQWLVSPSGQAADVPDALRAAVASALAAGSATLARMGGPRAGGQGKGRPPSAVYRLEISGAAPMRVTGGQAVVDMVNKELAELGDRYRLTVNNMTTIISTRGEWWRNVDTGSGTVTLSVQRIHDDAETGTNLASAQNENK